MVEPYRNDVEYLEDELSRLELRIEVKLAERSERDDRGSRESRVSPAGKQTLESPGPTRVDDLERRRHEVERRIGSRKAATRATGWVPALDRICESHALDDFERDLLVLALAPALDLRFADLYDRMAYKYRGRTVDTALRILCDTLADKVSARRYFMLNAPLLKHHLLALEQDRWRADEDILNLELKLPRRVMNLLLGTDALDESLMSFSRLVDPDVSLDQVVLATDQKERVMRLVENHDLFVQRRQEWGFDRVISYGRGMVLLFAGPPGTGKTMLANAMAHHMGKRLLLVNTDRLYDRVHTLESNIENVFREARLQNGMLFFDECEMLFADRRMGNSGVAELLTALERFEGIAILATNLAPTLDEAMDRRILLRVDFEIPSPELRERIWANHLPAAAPIGDDVDLHFLAHTFEFTGGYIKNAVLTALHEVLARRDEEPCIRQADLVAAGRTQLRQRMGSYTDRIVPQVGLDQVILPASLREQIVEIVEATRNRATVFLEWGLAKRLSMGRGLGVMFQGSPGTGKTLTAEAIAHELARNLFQVSLPSVVSKFVGDTEKNLRSVFAAARESQSVLFFDEADALFGKRTQVTGALDKYANMEVNVLLQELEKFDGLVIMATNLIGNVDSAFERRIAYRLTFPFPDARARAAIWKGMLPPEMPVAEIDFEYLGHKFDLSGGYIKNAVLKAAYRAARETGPRRVVTTQLLARAAEEELQGGFEGRGKIGFAAQA